MSNSIAVYSGYDAYGRKRRKVKGRHLPRRTKKVKRAQSKFAARMRACGRKFRHQRKIHSWRKFLRKCLKAK